MLEDFTRASFGPNGKRVLRLGLSATYRPGLQPLRRALDAGVNFLFCYGFDRQMVELIREIPPARRADFVIATGAYNLIWTHQNFRKTLEKRLRLLGTDYLDVFLFLGVMKPQQFPERLRDELRALKEDGRVRAVGMSCHDRKFAGRMAAAKELDVLMIRYNAAHPGAERDIFPHVDAEGPSVISYTATRWRKLLRRPPGWPRSRPVPDAPLCYRFVLSQPKIDVCLMAPAGAQELEENLTALSQGPLAEEEMGFMREFGDAVHRSAGWFL